MISGLSKAVTLCEFLLLLSFIFFCLHYTVDLAPVLMLTTLFLTFFTFFAPSSMLHDRVALLTVTPSTSLVQAGPSQAIDGPSLFLGLLGK